MNSICILCLLEKKSLIHLIPLSLRSGNEDALDKYCHRFSFNFSLAQRHHGEEEVDEGDGNDEANGFDGGEELVS